MKKTVVIPWIFLFLLFGPNDDARAEGSILSATLAKSQMMQIITPRLDWALANNNYAVQTFDADWEVVPNDSIALYQQARQVYIFAKGFEATSDNRYLIAMIKSADFMIDHMYDKSTSNWFASVSRDSLLQRSHPKEYDTAFALFAMAHAYDASKEKRYLDKALATWMLSDLATGFLLAKSKESSSAENIINSGTWSTNALMHLFEALLALHDVTKSGTVWQDIETIASFVATSLIQEESYVAEYYENVNQPLAISDGGYVELGHQIEWAYLLHTAVDKGLDTRYRIIANSLVEYALMVGWNDSEGSLGGSADYSMNLVEKQPVWWAQAEFMKLNLYFIKRKFDTSKSKYLLSSSYSFIVNSFLDYKTGGWFFSSQEGKRRPVGYHPVGMYSEELIEYY
ncbi:AGE family epimerase/isomerase [Alteromonas sp. A079]|uniref:AGE family epimerase/isomerase n=1 Tax=Alteromonas sp. A079 TaxID=3410268 RepID=UPI003BA26E04